MSKTTWMLVGILALGLFGTAGLKAQRPETDQIMKKLTPVIFVEEIEPCLEFWVDRLGFAKTMEVPEGDRLGFVAVQAGTVELMYQSRASVAGDIPALAAGPFHKSGVLFIEVTSLDALRPKLEGVELVFPERTTFYGSREIGVYAPCGTAVIFAEMPEQHD
jgi:uncharacterized glyoxalase superfamily protein PhnB